jgi:predicted DNA binding CopG/RHH family protein
MPSLPSDVEAERFVATADLSEHDLSGFKPMRFEVEPKSAALHMRLPEPLLNAIKAKAQARGIPYTRYVRMLLEADISHADEHNHRPSSSHEP